MRLDKEEPSQNVEDRRGQGGAGGGFGFPGGGRGFPGGGRRINIPMGGRGGGMSMGTILLIIVLALGYWLITGRNPINDFGGGGIQLPGGQSSSEYQVPNVPTDSADAQGTGPGTGTANVTTDAGKDFVGRVLGSTERVWDGIFRQMGRTYEKPPLVLFSGFVQSACGNAQAATGPFYCPRDSKVYIDLSFYQEMKDKLGAPGDFAQAYVIAHEVAHHVQNQLGIADKVMAQRARVSEAESNALSVRMELQADCYAGVWAQEANAKSQILEEGDIEEGLNAAAAIGDDRLQKKSQGYVVPESFTHGTSEQRVRWFKKGFAAQSLDDCDSFATNEL